MAKAIDSNRQWEVEDALRTLQRADTIQKDKKLMSEVTKQHNSVSQLLKKGGPVKAAPAKVSPTKKK